MATWFEITFTGDPTEADFARVSELAAQGFTSGQLLNDPEPAATDEERTAYLDGADQAGEIRLPKPGVRFEHALFLNPRGSQGGARCTVTAVRGSRVYFTYTEDYDAGDHHGPWYFEGKISEYVRRWL